MVDLCHKIVTKRMPQGTGTWAQVHVYVCIYTCTNAASSEHFHSEYNAVFRDLPPPLSQLTANIIMESTNQIPPTI